MSISELNIPILDGTGTTRQVRSDQSSVDESIAFHHVVEVAGTDVSSGNPFPVQDSAAESSLSTIASNTSGLATSSAQSTGNTSLATIASNTSGLATASAQSTANSSLSTIATETTAAAGALGTTADSAWSGSGSSSVVAALKAIWSALSGVATASNQSTGNTSLSTIATETTASAGALGTTGDSAWSGSGSSSIVAALKGLFGRLPAAFTPASALKVGGTTANPTSTLTRPSNTTAYILNNTIASSTTASTANAAIPHFTATPTSGGSGRITGARMLTNVTTGWSSVSVEVDLWSSAPALTNGDGGAYLIATGSANWLGSISFTFIQMTDGAYAAAATNNGGSIDFALASGTSIYWTMQITSGGGANPQSGQTFTLVPTVLQD